MHSTHTAGTASEVADVSGIITESSGSAGAT
jgi:hypothetical protein